MLLPSPYNARCSRIMIPATCVLHPSCLRGSPCHSHSPSIPGKGSSSPHLGVSMDTGIALCCPLCPEAASISHGAHPSCSLACPAQALPSLTLQHRWLPAFCPWPRGSFSVTLGARLEAVELGTLNQVYTGPLFSFPLHPALLRLESCLELNRAPTLSLLGHVPIGCPWGNRVTEGIC